MPSVKRVIFAATATAAMACIPVAPAAAGVHGFGHPWGLGRGLVGAVVGLATLPLTIVSAALAATDQPAANPSPGYEGSRGYAPPPAYYAAPQTYYAPPPAYYARAPVYYAAPRNNYAPRPYYAPRSNYAPRPNYAPGPSYARGPNYAPRPNYAPGPNYATGGYGGRGPYRSGGYGYPHR